MTMRIGKAAAAAILRQAGHLFKESIAAPSFRLRSGQSAAPPEFTHTLRLGPFVG
ncbi:MAG: hypothetical protein ACI8QS_000015 [Planctomycetota bacterium]|jgi:hypothetical protein